MADLTQWVVEARPQDTFVLWHITCHQESDPLDMKALSVLNLWAEEHVCEAAPGPRTDQARPLTWGTVPAGWYVKAPDGQWYGITATHYRETTGQQYVTMGALGTWTRDPQGPVTACPGPPNATDAAIEALGFPRVLEDGL